MMTKGQKKIRVIASRAGGAGKKRAEKLTLAEWINTWFETYSKPLIRPSTAKAYQSFIKNHIIPNIGDNSLSGLEPIDIQKMYNSIKTTGRVQTNPRKARRDWDSNNAGNEGQSLSSGLVRSVHSLLLQCLEQAVRNRLITYNPVSSCKPPPKEKSEMRIIPSDKIGAYLKAADECGFLPMFFLELSSGLRRGELLALLWSDLDAADNTISITKQVTGTKGGLVVSAPKTPNSIRVIAIPEQATELLSIEHAKHPNNPYMFPSPVTGKMYYPDSVGRIHKRILVKAGLEKNRFHDLRHTFSTLALQNGVDIKTLSNMLGHYSAGFTLDTYTHVTDKVQREAAKKVGSFMKQATGAI